MDIFQVMAEGQKAVDFVRSGNGPVLLEFDTYRYRGHSMSDPATYRSKEELNCKKEQDPIDSLKNSILEHKIANEDDFKSIENKIKAQINDVVEFAKNSPEPAESELLTEIYH